VSEVTTQIDGHVGIVQFSNPPVNYFTANLLNNIVDESHRLIARGCRALVLTSLGRHFCAGADFSSSGGDPTATTAFASTVYQAAVRMFHINKPVVAAIQGAAIGGGLGLACATDFRVADAATRFQANFGRLGFHHGFGLTLTLPRVVGHQAAADLLLGGRCVDGPEAHRIGLVDRLAQPGQSVARAIELAHELAASAPLAVEAMRATMRADLIDRIEDAIAHELSEQSRLWRTHDSQAAMKSIADKTPPHFVGR
jgi:2-(1,2-epoxy-1,2-dihydrophenyl)acetyl-CoA isomerase